MSQSNESEDAPERLDSRAIESLTFRLIVLMNLITKPFNSEHGARHGIPLSEWRCIMWLAAHPGASGQATATGIGMDRMSVSRNLRSLENKNLVLRTEDHEDRKRWNWRLSGGGWSVYDQIIPAAIERDSLLTNNLNSLEQQIVQTFLENTRANLELTDTY